MKRLRASPSLGPGLAGIDGFVNPTGDCRIVVLARIGILISTEDREALLAFEAEPPTGP